MTWLLKKLPKRLNFAALMVIVVLLTQLLGQAGTELSRMFWPPDDKGVVMRLLMEFLAAATFVAAAFWIRQAWPRSPNSLAWFRALVMVFAIIASNSFFTSASATVKSIAGHSTLWWLLLLVVFGVSWTGLAVHQLPAVQKWFHSPEDRNPKKSNGHPSGHIIVVMLVSAIDNDSLTFHDGEAGAMVTGVDSRSRERVTRAIAFQSLNADITNLAHTHWSWQQMLRGIEPVVARPAPADRTTIVLVGSSGPTGSFIQLDKCIRFLRNYPELNGVMIEKSPESARQAAEREGGKKLLDDVREEGINFEDFNEVKRHLFLVVLDAASKVGDERVFVDVTGGQKTTSIAAAVATTGEAGFCQYVQTKSPYELLFYDLHPPELPAV